MIEFERRKKIDTTIEITPLVDCVFILLIFFLLTSSFIEDMGFKINLPKAVASSVIDENKVNIFIDRNEKIYMNNKEIALDDLKVAFVQNTEKLIDIKSDEDVKLKIITKVMDMAKGCGIKRISIATTYKKQ